jgi:hypothetical protein
MPKILTAQGQGVFVRGDGTFADPIATSQDLPLPVEDGGTGASTVAGAQANLGVAATPAAQHAPSSPNTLDSTTPVMAGLGITYEPTASGNVLVIITGTISCSGSGTATATVGGRYGTGTPPANGAAPAGTDFPAADLTVMPNATGHSIPFMVTAMLSLTAGTTYWIDLAASSQSSTGAALASLNVFLAEQATL